MSVAGQSSRARRITERSRMVSWRAGSWARCDALRHQATDPADSPPLAPWPVARQSLGLKAPATRIATSPPEMAMIWRRGIRQHRREGGCHDGGRQQRLTLARI